MRRLRLSRCILYRTFTGGIWQNDSVGYSYDNLGRRNGMSVQQDASNNDNTVYAYNDLNRLSSLTSGAGTFGYSYVGNSDLLNQVDLPNGEKSTGHLNKYLSNPMLLQDLIFHPYLGCFCSVS